MSHLVCRTHIRAIMRTVPIRRRLIRGKKGVNKSVHFANTFWITHDPKCFAHSVIIIRPASNSLISIFDGNTVHAHIHAPMRRVHSPTRAQCTAMSKSTMVANTFPKVLKLKLRPGISAASADQVFQTPRHFTRIWRNVSDHLRRLVRVDLEKQLGWIYAQYLPVNILHHSIFK